MYACNGSRYNLIAQHYDVNKTEGVFVIVVFIFIFYLLFVIVVRLFATLFWINPEIFCYNSFIVIFAICFSLFSRAQEASNRLIFL